MKEADQEAEVDQEEGETRSRANRASAPDREEVWEGMKKARESHHPLEVHWVEEAGAASEVDWEGRTRRREGRSPSDVDDWAPGKLHPLAD